MIRVTKTIRERASFSKELPFNSTIAAGELEFVKKSGFMCCANGDDHSLTAKERKLVADHDPADGDLELESGPLNTAKPRPCVK